MRFLAFHSYKGGSGKSTLALYAAQALSSRGEKVLLIETDFLMPMYCYLFPDQGVYFNQYFEDALDINDIIFKTESYDVIINSPDIEQTEPVLTQDYREVFKLTEKLYQDLLQTGYSFVIFDFAPGVQFFNYGILRYVNQLFIILRADIASYEGTQGLLEKYYSIGVHNECQISLVFNQVPELQELQRLIDRWQILFEERFKIISHVIQLPYDPSIALLSAKGHAIHSSDSISTKGLDKFLTIL